MRRFLGSGSRCSRRRRGQPWRRFQRRRRRHCRLKAAERTAGWVSDRIEVEIEFEKRILFLQCRVVTVMQTALPAALPPPNFHTLPPVTYPPARPPPPHSKPPARISKPSRRSQANTLRNSSAGIPDSQAQISAVAVQPGKRKLTLRSGSWPRLPVLFQRVSSPRLHFFEG